MEYDDSRKVVKKRETPEESVTCTSCKKINPQSFVFCGACGEKLPARTQPEVPAILPSRLVKEGEWPMLRRDAAYTGSDGTPIPPPLEQVWEFKAGSRIESHPALAYGMVYFGCNDKKVYALEAATGQSRWTFKTGKAVKTTPVVADGTVFLASDDKNIYALDAQTGEKRWQFSPGKDISSTPAVGHGLVFFGSKDKHIYALDSATGQVKWTVKSGRKEHSAPTLADGLVLISGKEDLFAIDALSGELAWSNEAKGPLSYLSNPCPIVLGWGHPLQFVLTPQRQYYKSRSLALSDGSHKGKVYGYIATISHGLILSVSDPGYVLGASPGLFAYDLVHQKPQLGVVMDEATTKKYIDKGWRISVPAVGGNYVYTAILGWTKLIAFNVSKVMNRYEVHLKERIASAPVIANGMLFVTTAKGKIQAFRGSSDPQATAALEYLGDEIRKDLEFKAMPATGSVIWPNCCCLCCGPVEKHTDLRWDEMVFMTREQLTLPNLPYCNACYDKVTKFFRGENFAVKITKFHPPTLGFRNQKYWTMFMEANNLR